MARRMPSAHPTNVVIACTPPSRSADVRAAADTFLRPLIADHVRHDVLLALDEVVSNAIQYAPADRPIVARLSVDKRQVAVAVEDGGEGFDPAILNAARPRPDAESGRGLYLVRALMDGVEVRLGHPGTVVRFVRQLSGESRLARTPGRSVRTWPRIGLLWPIPPRAQRRLPT